MSEDIQGRLDQAALALAEGRPANARNAYARAAALSRETGKPLMRALALRHLSALDRTADKPTEALAHAEQALALYRRHAPDGRLDIANAIKLTAQALDALGRSQAATKAWADARDGYAATGSDEDVAACDARLASIED